MVIKQLLTNFVTVKKNKKLTRWHTKRKYLWIWIARYGLQ